MENNVPDLDAMPADDLMSFWAKHRRGRGYRELFPNGGKGTMRATWDLANYASNKATATQCQLLGAIDTALIYESIADHFYGRLPYWAKW